MFLLLKVHLKINNVLKEIKTILWRLIFKWDPPPTNVCCVFTIGLDFLQDFYIQFRRAETEFYPSQGRFLTDGPLCFIFLLTEGANCHKGFMSI